MKPTIDRRTAIKSGIAALASLAVGEVILLTPGETATLPSVGRAGTGGNARGRRKIDYARATKVPSVCLNCSTVCGIVGTVVDGKVVKISGNPADPNNGVTLCAKGQAGAVLGDNADRLLFPLRRVGARGEGLWKRITWDEVYEESARRIRKAMDEGVPEEVALHVGRSRIGAEITRFMSAIGSPTQLNHRALCSSAKRAANYASLGETDWESIDAERSKYFLNFGSNFYEAHQGAIHLAKRIVRGRFDNGAKLVTFDVRLSNTAGRSDEWFANKPGTEGAIALAMGHTILAESLHDAKFIETWCNVGVDELRAYLKEYTPEWAAALSGVPAADIRRLAIEFAKAAPRCAAFTNRGAEAHYNGFHNGRAVVMLNALVGSVGQVGGYTYTEEPRVPSAIFPEVQPVPPRPTRTSILENPPDWPLANKWQRMRVGQIVYAYLKEGRAKIQVYISYTLAAPTTWPEGRSLAVEVLKDERLIPFHICSDVVYSETAHYADIIVPDAMYTERWGFDFRNNMELRRYINFRQPLQAPPPEVRSFVDVLVGIGQKLGPDVAKYFPFKDHEDYMRQRCAKYIARDGSNGWDHIRKTGVWVDEDQKPFYEYFNWELTPKELEGSRVDPATNFVIKPNKASKDAVIGIVVDGKARRGFPTPSRKFTIRHQDVIDAGKQVGFPDDGMPRYVQIPAHENMPDDRFHLVTFKWNVHTQGRTSTQKYLTEIVHYNSMWMNTATAASLGVKTGDKVEITTYRPKGATFNATGEKLGSLIVPVVVTEGIHPRVFAMSNSLGHAYGGRAALGRNANAPAAPLHVRAPGEDDDDLTGGIWWDENRGGKGNGFNINAILPIQPSPLVGMQGWFDTTCSVRRV